MLTLYVCRSDSALYTLYFMKNFDGEREINATEVQYKYPYKVLFFGL
jgi:hypothetical protein